MRWKEVLVVSLKERWGRDMSASRQEMHWDDFITRAWEPVSKRTLINWEFEPMWRDR